MKEFKYVVTEPAGIHARPAGEFVKAASKFDSRRYGACCKAGTGNHNNC